MEPRANDSHKQQRHVSWNDAWSAEKQRERVRLAACREIPTAGPVRLFLANVARELPRIKARTLQYFSWRSSKHRPNTGGMQMQTSVSGDDQEKYYVLESEQALEVRGPSVSASPRTGDSNDVPQLEEFTEERGASRNDPEDLIEHGRAVHSVKTRRAIGGEP
jgi:hypothetical protein